jgi:hypothetical protein
MRGEPRSSGSSIGAYQQFETTAASITDNLIKVEGDRADARLY